MDRKFYYIGIAFFGMVNGLFNQTWLLFALIHAQILSPALLFGSVGLTFYVRLVDGLDRDDHCGRDSRRHLRARGRGQGPIRPKRRCGSGSLRPGF